ncbi:DNA methyltransferase 1-associated protein 1-like [Bolinopsis microptera]|uniref:DNA methyltransferase 1-associated protein 1-like n=1 Tax=Bolinopsis microptera TaxID=2820187 RepID=UPI00307976BC
MLVHANKVRSWQWKPFKNSARSDNLSLLHWKRCDDTSSDYPFAKYSVKREILMYTDEQYNGVLQQPGWTRANTDHLIELANKFDLRFVVMQDRWDKHIHGTRSVEDLKDRYYSIQYRLDKLRDSESEKPKRPLYDADHERLRKEQLEKLYSRTREEVEEEEYLIEELRKIEIRRKEREKKQQDLQRLIKAADQLTETGPSNKKKKASATKKKEEETRSWRIQDKPLNAGVSLRSAKTKQALQVGLKKSKLVEQILTQLEVGVSPMPTEEITGQFNELRNDILFLLELKIAQETLQFDIQALKHRKETLVGDQTPAATEDTENEDDLFADTDIMGLNLDEALVTAGLTSSCSRKRRAASEIEKVTALLKKQRKNSKG